MVNLGHSPSAFRSDASDRLNVKHLNVPQRVQGLIIRRRPIRVVRMSKIYLYNHFKTKGVFNTCYNAFIRNLKHR
mgnify:CR=1 FL=1